MQKEVGLIWKWNAAHKFSVLDRPEIHLGLPSRLDLAPKRLESRLILRSNQLVNGDYEFTSPAVK